MQRRQFVRTALFAAASTCFSRNVEPLLAADQAVAPAVDRICLFTDHLDDHGYSYADVAKMLKPLQIAGPDLTVRGGGLVPPEQVVDELPKASAAFRDQGMSVPMLSTSLTSARDPHARPILSTMGQLGIRYFKLGYYHYHDLAKWESELDAERKNLASLLDLGKEFGVQAGFHNHAGAGIGGALWDTWKMLKPLDAERVGFYYDPAHGTIEGSNHAWKLNFQRVSPRLKMIAIKDFTWEKTASGWKTRWCPLGEGAVNWPEFFRMLSQFSFPGPLSIHIEYDPGGSTRSERIDNALAAAQRDVAFVKKHLTSKG